MSLVSLTLPSDGQTAHVADYNTPLNALADVINGKLDSTNIASLTGTKILPGTLPATALNASAAQGWQSVGQTLTYTGNNGNKEYTGTFPADMTGSLSPGMKFAFTRSTPAPTQAMAFSAASSQFATKASPAGITFTNSFTVEAWVYLNSYAGNTGAGVVVNRFDGSNGWGMQIHGDGSIQAFYTTSPNTTSFGSYAAIPLRRWTHVAVVVSSVSAKTVAVYMNGVSMPVQFYASASTSLTQPAADLRMGVYSGGTLAGSYFDGYISETRVWSAPQTQNQIQQNMAISLTGAEANLVGLWQGNGNFNDKTSNANNLTPTGAVATQAANPYNTTEYAVLTKVGAFSGGNTPVTFFTGTDYNLPNMVLNNALYSTQRAPFGFPASRGKWKIESIFKTTQSQASPTTGTWYHLNMQLTVPTGDWRYGYETPLLISTGASTITAQATLSTTNSSETNPNLSTEVNAANNAQIAVSVKREDDVTLPAATIHYLNIRQTTGTTGAVINFQSGDVSTVIKADCAYI